MICKIKTGVYLKYYSLHVLNYFILPTRYLSNGTFVLQYWKRFEDRFPPPERLKEEIFHRNESHKLIHRRELNMSWNEKHLLYQQVFIPSVIVSFSL